MRVRHADTVVASGTVVQKWFFFISIPGPAADRPSHRALSDVPFGDRNGRAICTTYVTAAFYRNRLLT